MARGIEVSVASVGNAYRLILFKTSLLRDLTLENNLD